MVEKVVGKGSKAISPDFLIDLLDLTEECVINKANCVEFTMNLGAGVKIKYYIEFQFIHEK